MSDPDAISEVVLPGDAAFPDAYQGRWISLPDRDDGYSITVSGRTLTERDRPVRFQSITTLVQSDGWIAAVQLMPFREDADDGWTRMNPHFLILDAAGATMSVVNSKSELALVRENGMAA